MDQRKFQFDWAKARSFLRVAKCGSFSAGARRLGVSQPTLGRQISALEEELGLVLFERVGRGVALTPSGRSLQPHIERMAAAAGEVSILAAAQG